MVKKILVVSRHFWPENSRAAKLCMGLSELGLKVDVLCGQPSDDDGEFVKGYNSFKVRRETYKRINIYRSIDTKKGNGSNLNVFKNYVAFPLFSLLNVKKLCKNSYDAVLIFQTSPVFMGIAGSAVAKKMNIPVYMYVADLWPHTFYSEVDVQSSVFKRIVSKISASVYEKADKIIVPSEKMKKYFTDLLTIDSAEIACAEMFPDSEFSENTPDDNLLEKTAGSFNCVIPGDFGGVISPKVIVDTALKIRQSGIRTIRFIVIGKGEEIDRLRKMVSEKNLGDYFFFEGRVRSSDIGKYINLADVMLAVLKVGNFCEYCLPEYVINLFAAGKPLVMSMNGNVREIIRKNKCGFASEADDADALYSNILRVYTADAEKRNQMGINAKNYQTENHDYRKSVQKIYDVVCGKVDYDENADSSIRRLWD